MSAKEYFLSEEEKLINEWADKSVKLFRYIFQYVGSQEMSLKANTNSKAQNLSKYILRIMRVSLIRARNSSRHFAFSTEK